MRIYWQIMLIYHQKRRLLITLLIILVWKKDLVCQWNKDVAKNLIQFRKRMREARRSDIHNASSSINSNLPKNPRTKELWDQELTKKPIITKEKFSHVASFQSNYKTAVSNNHTDSDSVAHNQRMPLKYKIQDMIKSGLKGYIKSHKRKKRGSIEPKSKSIFNFLTNRIKATYTQFWS